MIWSTIDAGVSRTVLVDACFKAASMLWDVQQDQILARNRSARPVAMRCIMYASLRTRGLTFQQIAAPFERNHGTIMHAIQCWEDETDAEFLENDAAFNETFDKILAGATYDDCLTVKSKEAPSVVIGRRGFSNAGGFSDYEF